VSEQVLYSKADLDRHMRTGDDAGPLAEAGFKGHPLCRFCKKRFYDGDELYRCVCVWVGGWVGGGGAGGHVRCVGLRALRSRHCCAAVLLKLARVRVCVAAQAHGERARELLPVPAPPPAPLCVLQGLRGAGR
jgi:hypothetical protein